MFPYLSTANGRVNGFDVGNIVVHPGERPTIVTRTVAGSRQQSHLSLVFHDPQLVSGYASNVDGQLKPNGDLQLKSVAPGGQSITTNFTPCFVEQFNAAVVALNAANPGS